MTVKDFASTVSPNMVIAVHTATTLEDAQEEKSNSPLLIWNVHDTCADTYGMSDREVVRIVPVSQKRIDVWVIAHPIFISAKAKLGTEGVFYLEHRYEVMRHQFEKGSERLAAVNEGRIEGYLRALKHSGKFTPEELTALSEHYL